MERGEVRDRGGRGPAAGGRGGQQLGRPDTCDAEYVALTRLQGDAFVTLDEQLADPVRDLVAVAPISALG